MATKGGNRQQKQAAKAVRRRQIVAAKHQTERLASSLSGKIAAAAAAPLEQCLRTADMEAAGIGQVVVAKRLPSGILGCGFFLVDLLCLGVKDVFYRELSPSDFEEHVRAMADQGQSLRPMDAASAKTLVLGAVAFAETCGMEPAKSYATIVRLFDPVDAADAAETFVFGRNGEPIFVPGPNDSAARLRDVERRLIRSRGQDIEITSGLSEAERISLRSLASAAGGPVRDDEPLVIDHEPSPDGPEA